MEAKRNEKLGARRWASILLIGLFGQIAWAIENNYINLWVYSQSHDAAHITWMTAASSVVATVTTFFIGALILFLSTFSALGYGAWGDIRFFGMQFLDFFDFVSNSVLMPIVAVASCLFIGWIVGPRTVVDEVTACGQPFKGRLLYIFMVKYFAPLLVGLILIQQVGAALGIQAFKI